MPYSDEDLLEHIRILAREVGHPPTLTELRDHSPPSATTYYNRFGSWQAALEAAGLDARDPATAVDEEALIDELHRLTDELGEVPTAQQMDGHGEHWASAYQDHFGSWAAALRTAGYNPTSRGQRLTDEQLREALKDLGKETESPPTMVDMDADGPYSASTYVRHFGSWQQALADAGFPARARSIPEEDLLAELRRLTRVVDGPPTRAEVDEYGAYSASTYYRRFGSWDAALEAVTSDV